MFLISLNFFNFRLGIWLGSTWESARKRLRATHRVELGQKWVNLRVGRGQPSQEPGNFWLSNFSKTRFSFPIVSKYSVGRINCDFPIFKINKVIIVIKRESNG